MKKLAIFCDGTWNHLRMDHRTNVARLAKCVESVAADGVTPQIVFYDDGVGVGSDISKGTDSLTKYLGGGLGKGLDRKVEAAYRFLVTNYHPGDEIFIFGFSRGAYTARSLAGLIRKCGILRRDCLDLTPRAVEIYRNPLHPNAEDVIKFRRAHTHPVSSGREDYDRPDILESASTMKIAQNQTYQYRPAHSYNLMYLGLWDTVGSLGIPQRFGALGALFNGQYRFHDTDASSLIASLRHAVSIDETRTVFSATPVSNIEALNQEWADCKGHSLNPDDPHFVPYHCRPYQQVWFPGGHGAVGGGNPRQGLSAYALLWIAQGAVNAGLNLSTRPGTELDQARKVCEACDPWRLRKDGSLAGDKEDDFLGFIGGHRLRKGPETPDEVSDSAWERWCRDTSYRPKNLSVMTGRPCPRPAKTACEMTLNRLP